jgi:hypothetical protein
MLPSVIQALSSMRAELLQLLVHHLHVEMLKPCGQKLSHTIVQCKKLHWSQVFNSHKS